MEYLGISTGEMRNLGALFCDTTEMCQCPKCDNYFALPLSLRIGDVVNCPEQKCIGKVTIGKTSQSNGEDAYNN